MLIQPYLFHLSLNSSFFIFATLRLWDIITLNLVILQDIIDNTFIAFARYFIEANLFMNAVDHAVCWVLPMRCEKVLDAGSVNLPVFQLGSLLGFKGEAGQLLGLCLVLQDLLEVFLKGKL